MMTKRQFKNLYNKINDILKAKILIMSLQNISNNWELKKVFSGWKLSFNNKNSICILIDYEKLYFCINFKGSEIDYNELTLNIENPKTYNLKIIENLIDLCINLLTNNL